MIEALKILADQGNELAVEYLAFFNRPENLETQKLILLAAEADPNWEVKRDGNGKLKWLRPMDGAVHDTTEKLLEAYKQTHVFEAKGRS